MLHDPSHKPVIPEEKEIILTQKDKDILKTLGERIAQISGDRRNEENARNWTLLNDKKSVKPMVWINEIPWHEMNVNDELTLRCTHPWARNLEDTLKKYPGTVIVISHDREFLDGIVDKVYEFRDGGVKEYLGGIYYFLEKRKLESLQEVERRDTPQKPALQATPKPEAAVSGKLTYEQRKEQEKQLRKLRRTVEGIEAELAAIEKQIAAYDAKFAAATAYDEADYKAYNDLKARYDHQMHEWEKASYELELTEEQ